MLSAIVKIFQTNVCGFYYNHSLKKKVLECIAI